MNKYYQSDYNQKVRKSMVIPKEIVVNDVTLREAETNVDFSLEDKIQIINRLAELGIPLVQCGFPGRSKIDWDTIRAIKSNNIPIKVEAVAQVLSKDWKEQIDRCISCHPDILVLMYPNSPYRLKYVEKVSEKEMLQKSVDAVKYAMNQGVKIRSAPTDSTRASLPFLLDTYEVVVEAGAEIITLTDTFGIMTPSSMKYLVGEIIKKYDVPLQVHCHNDFGLALANTLAALEAGASILDATINGYGGRADNAALDELVVTLRIFYDIDLGIKLHMLTELSRYLEKLTGVPISPSKPIVGRNAFAHKLDAHIMSVLENPIVYEGFSPELVGNVRQILLGKHSGPFVIKKKAEMLGLSIRDDNLEAVRQEVMDYAIKNKSSITDDAFKDIVLRVEK